MKRIKRTPIYVVGIWFRWNCFECGTCNHENADPDIVKDRYIILRCHRCGAERRGKLPKEHGEPANKKRDRKLARIKQKWEDRLYAIWDKKVKERKRK